MKKIQILLGFVLFSLGLFADEAPHKMKDLLQRTQLIVHAKITSHTPMSVTIHVKEVLFNFRTGIKQGDYLNIQNDFSIVCPAEIPIEFSRQKKEAIFFLNYNKGKWQITAGDVAFFRDGKAQLMFIQEGYEYAGTAQEWKSDLTGYYDHFIRNEKNELRPLLDEKKWTKDKSLSPLAQLQYKSYYKDHFRSLEDHPRLNKANLYYPEEEEEEPFQTLVTAPGATLPISHDKMLEISAEVYANAIKKHPQLVEDQIEGFVYYHLSFREDGTIANLHIDTPLHGKVHDELRLYYKNHSKWPPALNDKGKPLRFKQSCQLIFKPNLE